ncbi:histidine phosphatase family protein [Streptomyces sp. NPDC005506]|uniref:histidine phosphatase family protein n=1 Tax=unclassified Streptomyces TaxID=2593676 RepID=UPI0036D18F79
MGRRQACELGEHRPGHGFARVFISDLHRAVQTARIAFPDGQLPIRQDIRLRECDAITATSAETRSPHRRPTSPAHRRTVAAAGATAG